MRFTAAIVLLITALCGCGDKTGRKPKEKSTVEVVNRIDNRYAGAWRGRSEKSEQQAGYEWIFDLSNNGRFSMRILNLESNFSEKFTGTWIGTESYITLFPDTAGNHFFPIVDKELAAEGVGIPVFVKETKGAFEFMFGCCDEGGRDYHVIASLVEPAGAGQPATKPADKPPVKDQPSTPTPKDGPR